MSDDTAKWLLSLADGLALLRMQPAAIARLRALAKRMPVLEAAEQVALLHQCYMDAYDDEIIEMRREQREDAMTVWRAAAKAAEEAEHDRAGATD